MHSRFHSTLAIIVPCYHEEEALPTTSNVLLQLLSKMISESLVSTESFICFVNDGSKDKTWEIIEELHEKNPRHIQGICLSRNFGHQSALLAGLHTLEADCYITIDADLQDDENAMVDMVKSFHEGNDIVYGVRKERRTDTFFKRTTAQGFYKVMEMMGVKTVYNHADFRLMSKRAVEQFSKYQETNLFLRGMMPLIGYQTDCVYYDRKERVAGESKYPLKKMLALAFNGISSFSVKPISMILGAGMIIVALSLLAAIYALISYCTGHVVPGWTSLILSIWFLGGIQLMAIGLVGQYIGKIYIEVKHRPRYNIEKVLK